MLAPEVPEEGAGAWGVRLALPQGSARTPDRARGARGAQGGAMNEWAGVVSLALILGFWAFMAWVERNE